MTRVQTREREGWGSTQGTERRGCWLGRQRGVQGPGTQGASTLDQQDTDKLGKERGLADSSILAPF